MNWIITHILLFVFWVAFAIVLDSFMDWFLALSVWLQWAIAVVVFWGSVIFNNYVENKQ